MHCEHLVVLVPCGSSGISILERPTHTSLDFASERFFFSAALQFLRKNPTNFVRLFRKHLPQKAILCSTCRGGGGGALLWAFTHASGFSDQHSEPTQRNNDNRKVAVCS